jgi:hypothetical protein
MKALKYFPIKTLDELFKEALCDFIDTCLEGWRVFFKKVIHLLFKRRDDNAKSQMFVG